MHTRTLTMSTAIAAFAAATAFAQPSQNTQSKSPQPSAQQAPASQNQSTGSQTGSTDAKSNQPASIAPANKGANSEQPGLRTVTGASLRLDFYAVGATDFRASDLMGMNVYNLNNESVGEIEDLVLDNGKNVKGIVVSVGGFLGLGDRNVAVQPGSVLIERQADGSERAVINTTKETLKNAPEFKFEARKKAGAQTMGARESSSTSPAPSAKDSSKTPK